MTWPESVDEAICYGWIDGVRRRLDDESYTIRFSPRKPDSIWSAINIAKAEALTAAGRIRPAGLEAFARRIERRSRVYSYEQQDGQPNLSAEQIRRFKQDRKAWEFFLSTPPGYRKVISYWVVTAKKADTRERRLAQLIEACASGTRLR